MKGQDFGNLKGKGRIKIIKSSIKLRRETTGRKKRGQDYMKRKRRYEEERSLKRKRYII